MNLQFNEALIPHIYRDKPKYKNLVKLVLYLIKEEIEVRNVLIWKINTSGISMSIDFSEDIISEMQEIILELERLEIIEKNYSDTKLVRWILRRNLYTTEIIDIDLQDDYIEELRKYFKKGYCQRSNRASTKDLVKKELHIWLENNPTIGFSELPEIFKYYVDSAMLNSPDYVSKITSFIDNENLKPDANLKYYINEYKEGNHSRGTFIE